MDYKCFAWMVENSMTRLDTVLDMMIVEEVVLHLIVLSTNLHTEVGTVVEEEVERIRAVVVEEQVVQPHLQDLEDQERLGGLGGPLHR